MITSEDVAALASIAEALARRSARQDDYAHQLRVQSGGITLTTAEARQRSPDLQREYESAMRSIDAALNASKAMAEAIDQAADIFATVAARARA